MIDPFLVVFGRGLSEWFWSKGKNRRLWLCGDGFCDWIESLTWRIQTRHLLSVFWVSLRLSNSLLDPFHHHRSSIIQQLVSYCTTALAIHPSIKTREYSKNGIRNSVIGGSTDSQISLSFRMVLSSEWRNRPRHCFPTNPNRTPGFSHDSLILFY